MITENKNRITILAAIIGALLSAFAVMCGLGMLATIKYFWRYLF